MKFLEERLTEELLKESEPLFKKHWEEISYYKDIELNPDYDLYFKLQELGSLRCYSARDNHGDLMGYAVFFVKSHPHYKQSIMAVQDIVFIDPDKRGLGLFLIKFCEEELKKIGVQVISHHIKFSHDWSAALEKLGYDKQDIIMTKRLDR